LCDLSSMPVQPFLLSSLLVGLICLCPAGFSTEPKYDPMAVSAAAIVRTLDLVMEDLDRDREIPLRVYLPGDDEPAPVILFSHGLGGSCLNNPYLGNHWAARGYVAVFMQHHGSDESIWKDVPREERTKSIKSAVSYQNAKLRFIDVSVVIDQLEAWNIDGSHVLNERMNLEKIGMSGHSFGAVTTQAVAGQKRLLGLVNYTDERIDAALAMSPSVPKGGRPKQMFNDVAIPWLLMTGTRDVSKIGGADVANRLSVFPALPAGDKYELVLYDAEHSAFSERALPGDQISRNSNHHRAILAISTAYWDAYLRCDDRAKQWLLNDCAQVVLEKQDRWEWK
ncbi:MAG: dienelactone hydrolase, partial [Lentimonas sp.]